jgi:iron complex outermembrane receptor protein
MPSLPLARNRLSIHLLALLAAGVTIGSRLAAAEAAPTRMDPFNVEAEFGVDGLRLRNSSSVLNQHLLDEHGVVQLQDVNGIAPSLYSSNSDSRGFGDVMSLRGIANSLFFSSPSVALYVDDVPGGSVSSYPSSLLNIDTLVVKAGPQGTDYGRNAAAGVIDIKSRAPGAKHSGKLSVDYGQFSSLALQAAFDGPIGGGAGYSLSLGKSEREGYIDNTFLRRTADDRNSFVGRGAVHLQPTGNLSLRLGALVEQVEDDATRLVSLGSVNRWAVASDLNGFTDIDRTQYSAHARLKVGGGTFISTTAWQDWEVAAATDLDLNPIPAAASRIAQTEEMFTQEFRFESTPTVEKSQWRLGLFFLDSTIDSDAVRSFIVPPSPFLPPGFTLTERTVSSIGQENLAAYANVDQSLAPGTMLKVGVRFERAESEIDRTKTSSNNFGFPVPPDPRLNASQSPSFFSATVGLTQAASDSLSFNARISLAHRPDGYSAFTATPALAKFGRERQTASEVGVTFAPPKGRFGGSVMGYYTVVDGYQFERTVPGSTDFVVINAQEVTVKGLEAKFMWSPVANVWWDFQAGAQTAQFDVHRDALGVDMANKKVPFIPEYTLRTGVTVDFGRGLSANASYALVGQTFFDERNTAAFGQGKYDLVNAQLRYRVGQWSATLYGHNLLEQDYWQFVNPEIFAGSPGAPRRVGVKVSWEF